MRYTLRGLIALLALAPFAVVGLAVPAAAANARTYRVTITNLTTGQPLTPPAVAVHGRSVTVFQVGQPASLGVQEIAENGNLSVLLADLAGTSHVAQAFAAGGPLVPEDTPGAAMFPDSVTFEVTTSGGVRFLSFVSMLICTNDGFTGVDGVRLPQRVGDVVTVHTNGYDAGTEINTEDFADIVPPCQDLIGISTGEPGTGTTNPALAEGGVIAHHPGIAGDADLVPDVHGWSDPVAEITVEAVG